MGTGDPTHDRLPGVDPGYNVSTTFDVTVADRWRPSGTYTVTLELIDVDAPATVLASETGTITVNANVADGHVGRLGAEARHPGRLR